MIRRLRCWFLGHDWTHGSRLEAGDWWTVAKCRRCHEEHSYNLSAHDRLMQSAIYLVSPADTPLILPHPREDS